MTGSPEINCQLIVLVVDDNQVIRELVKRQLGKLGITGETAAGGNQALAMLEERTYDLVLMDVQMPEIDGIACTKIIRQRDQAAGKHTKIVALTGYGSRVECIEAGMDDFIAKPMNIVTLQNMIERWLGTIAPAQDR